MIEQAEIVNNADAMIPSAKNWFDILPRSIHEKATLPSGRRDAPTIGIFRT